MIPIERPAIPAALAAAGPPATAELAAEADAARRQGRPPIFAFRDRVYAHDDVRAVLVAAHRGKCCYCESLLEPTTRGQVEHYRPKDGRDHGAGRVRPGYYWLAYAWDNLLLACPTCNRRKWDRFPLERVTDASASPEDRLSRERPLLVDPTREDPRESIDFASGETELCDIARPVDGSVRGRATIQLIDLDRAELVKARREWAADVVELHRTFAALSRIPNPPADIRRLLEAVRTHLARHRDTAGRYSAAVNASLPVK